MRKLALNDEILLKIEKPARYIGNEVNSVMKDKNKVDIRFAMCFPDVYEIGMSHLGIQILYDMFNRREDVWCERVYSPWTDLDKIMREEQIPLFALESQDPVKEFILYDMFNRREDVWCERVYSPWTDLDKIMREEQIPLFALESQDPVKEFDFLGITIQYEMCYTNILQILDLSGIPLFSKDRDEDDPIVIGGGPCTYNPEPIADFFDIFYIGEGETVYDELLEAYKRNKACGGTRIEFLEKAAEIEGLYVPMFYDVEYGEGETVYDELLEAYKRNKACGGTRIEFLEKAAEIEGLYVPMFYDVEYKEDGTIASFRPNNAHAKETIKKQMVLDFTDVAEIEGLYVPMFYDVEYKEDGTIASFRPNNAHAKETIKKQMVLDFTDVCYPEKPVVPFIKVTQDRVVLEIMRHRIESCWKLCVAVFVGAVSVKPE